MLMESSGLQVSKMGIGNMKKVHTVLVICRVHVDVQLFISLQGLLQDNNLLLALDFSRSRVRLTLAIALHTVQLDHLLYTFQVLLFNVELELDLRQHELDAGTKIRVIIFDQVCSGSCISQSGRGIEPQDRDHGNSDVDSPSFVKLGLGFGIEELGPGGA